MFRINTFTTWVSHRALLRDAPILLLDEAPSALDSQSEQVVQQALEWLMAKRTTLVIAPRLSTIQHADMIYVIDRGGVVEQGQHEFLMAQGGLYERLRPFPEIKYTGEGNR